MMPALKLNRLVIPLEMLNERRWIPVARDKKPMVKAWNRSKNWERYDEIRTEGKGFVLGDGFFGIDLDDCLNESGSVKPEKSQIVNDVLELCPSFCEVSVSGKGLHVYAYGKMNVTLPMVHRERKTK